jgi:transcriptional regulator with XRE-family HTH domain
VGLTQAEAGKRVGVSQPSWRAWELGESVPSAAMAARIQDATGVPADSWRSATGRKGPRRKAEQ